MRLAKTVIVGFALLFPAVASAQTPKLLDVAGTWEGSAMALDPSVKPLKGTGWLILWPDSLYWDFRSGGSWGSVYEGRWRLVGDTLSLAHDYNRPYGPAIRSRLRAVCKGNPPTSDSLPQPDPSSNPGFWSDNEKDNNSPHRRRRYKVTRADQQLSLTLLDSLAKNPQAKPTDVYKVAPQPLPKIMPGTHSC